MIDTSFSGSIISQIMVAPLNSNLKIKSIQEATVASGTTYASGNTYSGSVTIANYNSSYSYIFVLNRTNQYSNVANCSRSGNTFSITVVNISSAAHSIGCVGYIIGYTS